MNFYSIIGMALAGLVVFFGLRFSTDNLHMFFDPKSLFIVIGGTIAATAISFQVNRIFSLLKIFFARVLMGRKTNFKKIIMELLQIVERYRKDGDIESSIAAAKDPFIKESLALVNDDIMDKQDLVDLLVHRSRNLYSLHLEEANKIKTIGKFPPAFGMMGTTIGMIVLLANIGGPESIKKVAPAMGLALITTLYGLIIANLIVIPIAENLIENAKETYLKNSIVVEAIRLLLEKKNPIYVAERLNSYLEQNQRLDWKKVLGRD